MHVHADILKGYMPIFENTEGVHGKRKVGNPWLMWSNQLHATHAHFFILPQTYNLHAWCLELWQETGGATPWFPKPRHNLTLKRTHIHVLRLHSTQARCQVLRFGG